jgi:hypothetical protein
LVQLPKNLHVMREFPHHLTKFQNILGPNKQHLSQL